MNWYEAKQFVEQATDLSMDSLHVIAGTVLFLGFSLLLYTARRRQLSLPVIIGE